MPARSRSRSGCSPSPAKKSATDLPLIVFQYANELAYDLDTLVKLTETIPAIKAVKDWPPGLDYQRGVLCRPVCRHA
jgi:hypothetical protein